MDGSNARTVVVCAPLLQIDVNDGETVDSRRRRVAALVREQAGVDLVVLPELWTTGAFAYEAFGTEAESSKGRRSRSWRRRRATRAPGCTPGRSPSGTPTARSTTPPSSSPLRRPGRRLPQDPPLRLRQGRGRTDGRGRRTGDGPAAGDHPRHRHLLRPPLPELFRGLVDAGAETSSSAGWPERRRSHWTLLAQARAVENQAFVLACGTAGTHAGVPQAGHSIVVDPWGGPGGGRGRGAGAHGGLRPREGRDHAGAVPGAEGPDAGTDGTATLSRSFSGLPAAPLRWPLSPRSVESVLAPLLLRQVDHAHRHRDQQRGVRVLADDVDAVRLPYVQPAA